MSDIDLGKYGRIWLNAKHLPDKGANATITEVREEEVWDPRARQETDRITVAFAKTPKILILNNTQINQLVEMLGDKTSAWVGAVVHLAPLTLSNKKVTIDISEANPTAKGKQEAEHEQDA